MFVSIIIPAYNCAKTIAICLNSILIQENTDYEILVIDDGSNDGTSDIIDGFATKNNRIRVIHKINGGVSSARNLGIKEAQGEWLMFCDADDTFEPDALNMVCDVVAEHDNDYYCFQYIAVNCDGTRKRHISATADCEYTSIEYIKQILLDRVNKACWGNLFRSSIAKTVKFDSSLSIGEDIYYVLNYITSIKTNVFVSSKVIYDYVNNSSSVTHDKEKMRRGLSDINVLVLDFLRNKGIIDQCRREYNIFAVTNITYSLYCLKLPDSKSQMFLKSISTEKEISNNQTIKKYISFLHRGTLLANVYLEWCFIRTRVINFLLRISNKGSVR